MRVLNLLRSLGGVFLIAIGAIIAAFVGKYTQQWVFIPIFIVFETVAFFIYYKTMYKVPKGEKK